MSVTYFSKVLPWVHLNKGRINGKTSRKKWFTCQDMMTEEISCYSIIKDSEENVRTGGTNMT